MYTKWFYITEPVWNNALSYGDRENKSLYVPSIAEATIDDVKKWVEIVFEDFDFNWKLRAFTGLQNFYRIAWQGKEIVLFDNHNHAFYFWYEARSKWLIWNNCLLMHIDEHSDMRDPWTTLEKPKTESLQEVFRFTNHTLNVWNYIVPALREGLVWDVVQIRNETNLRDYLEKYSPHPTPLPRGEGIEQSVATSLPLGEIEWGQSRDIILNLDLDFFQPDLDFIDYELKKKVVLDVAKRAKVITVASSPFFIDQDLALKVFKDLFGN